MKSKTITKAAVTATGADLNALRVFAAVADAGGITAGAELLGLSKARVSIELARLESALGVSLFTRTTRRVALTDAGHAERTGAMRRAPLSVLGGIQRMHAQCRERIEALYRQRDAGPQ